MKLYKTTMTVITEIPMDTKGHGGKTLIKELGYLANDKFKAIKLLYDFAESCLENKCDMEHFKISFTKPIPKEEEQPKDAGLH